MTRYLATLSDSNLESQFETAQPSVGNPTTLSENVFKQIGSFFSNTGKSAENANKITERVEKGMDKYSPYIIAGGVLVGLMALTQTIKNVQDIEAKF